MKPFKTSFEGRNLRSQDGFSLIETLIGLSFFALVGTIVLCSLAASSKSNIINGNLTNAESLARTQLEYIQNQPYKSTNNGTIYPPTYLAISLPAGYSFVTPIANMVTRINSSGNSVTSDDGLQQITVSIKYKNNSLYTITGYKVNR